MVGWLVRYLNLIFLCRRSHLATITHSIGGGCPVAAYGFTQAIADVLRSRDVEYSVGGTLTGNAMAGCVPPLYIYTIIFIYTYTYSTTGCLFLPSLCLLIFYYLNLIICSRSDQGGAAVQSAGAGLRDCSASCRRVGGGRAGGYRRVLAALVGAAHRLSSRILVCILY